MSECPVIVDVIPSLINRFFKIWEKEKTNFWTYEAIYKNTDYFTWNICLMILYFCQYILCIVYNLKSEFLYTEYPICVMFNMFKSKHLFCFVKIW